MNKLVSFFTLLFWCGGLQAQVDLNHGEVVQPTFHDTIPFEYIRGKMRIELEIGGKLRKFILDTGAPCAVFDHLQREIGAPITHKDSMRDIAGGIMELDRTELPSFKLGQLEFRNIPALVMREQTGSLLKCWGVDGIIGSNALRNCILQIDLKARRLILSNQLHELDLSNHSTVPLHLSEQESDPYLELTLSEDHVILANFDTGDEEIFSISEEDAALPLERQRAHLSNTGHGKMIISLTESQQDQWFKLVNFDTLTIDATHFMNFNSELWEEQHVSRVGIGLGEYGIITVDYLNQQFHFQDYEKKQWVVAEPYPTDQGFSIYPTEDGYVIGIVWNDSPAAKLGLKSGYKIWRIGGVDFSKRSSTLDCELVMGVHKLRDVIHLEYLNDDGKIVAVSIGKE